MHANAPREEVADLLVSPVPPASLHAEIRTSWSMSGNAARATSSSSIGAMLMTTPPRFRGPDAGRWPAQPLRRLGRCIRGCFAHAVPACARSRRAASSLRRIRRVGEPPRRRVKDVTAAAPHDGQRRGSCTSRRNPLASSDPGIWFGTEICHRGRRPPERPLDAARDAPCHTPQAVTLTCGARPTTTPPRSPQNRACRLRGCSLGALPAATATGARSSAMRRREAVGRPSIHEECSGAGPLSRACHLASSGRVIGTYPEKHGRVTATGEVTSLTGRDPVAFGAPRAALVMLAACGGRRARSPAHRCVSRTRAVPAQQAVIRGGRSVSTSSAGVLEHKLSRGGDGHRRARGRPDRGRLGAMNSAAAATGADSLAPGRAPRRWCTRAWAAA